MLHKNFVMKTFRFQVSNTIVQNSIVYPKDKQAFLFIELNTLNNSIDSLSIK